METTEWMVIIVCGLLGYGTVSWLADRQKANQQKANQESEAGGHEAPSGAHHSSSENHWSYVLGVPTTASLDEVKHAYRLKIQQYHPDRLGPGTTSNGP